jgi:succinyl-CoA synthetase beta subunit
LDWRLWSLISCLKISCLYLSIKTFTKSKPLSAPAGPLIVRLQGTNAVEAKQLIDDAGLPIHSAITLEEAANKVSEVLA